MKRCIIGWTKTDWLGCSKIVSYTYTSHNPLQPICLICFLIISSPFILEDKDGTWFSLRSYFICSYDLSNISSLTFFFLACHFVFFRYTVAFQGYSIDITESIIILRCFIPVGLSNNKNKLNGIYIVTNTTIFLVVRLLGITKVQVYVSAINVGNLQVVHEELINKLYQHVWEVYCLWGGGWEISFCVG